VKFLTGFGMRPQHLMGGIGVFLFGLGSLGLSILTVIWLLTQVGGFDFAPIGNRPLLHYSVAALLLGAQIISLGLVAELLVAYTGRNVDAYSISERTSAEASQPETINV
jgi:hypothetical protein